MQCAGAWPGGKHAKHQESVLAPPAAQLDAAGQTGIAITLRDAASTAFVDGFGAACLVAAGVVLAGAVMAATLLPTPTAQAN